MSESTITKIQRDGANWRPPYWGANPMKLPCGEQVQATDRNSTELRTVLRDRGWRRDKAGDFCEKHRVEPVRNHT